MKHLIFDIDGTIWNTTGVVADAWNKVVARSGIEALKNLVITDKVLQKEFGKPMDVIADDLFGNIDPKVKAELLKECCEDEHEAIRDNKEDLSYEKIRETMRELAADNRLYIVSNCQKGYIELVMDKNGITDIISDHECFGNTGLQKDENIRLLMERNGIEEAVYIGDTLGDHQASRKAGVKFVFARYGFGEVPDYDGVIDTPADLLNVVQYI